MKKNILFALVATAAVLASCKKQSIDSATTAQNTVGPKTITASMDDSKAISNLGVLTFAPGELIDVFYADKTKESISLTADMISNNGKTATFDILGTTAETFAVYPGISNTKWTTGDGPKYSMGNKATGYAAGKITGNSLVLTNVCSVISFSADAIPSGSTFAYIVPKSNEAVVPSQVQFNFATGEASGSTLIKYGFTNVLSDKNDIRITVFPGDYFEDGFSIAFANAYGAPKEVIGKRLFVNKSLAVGQGEFIRLGNIDNNTVVLGTEAYRTVTLKDGNTWMAENLRYVPAGKTIADLKEDYTGVTCDGIYYPATYSRETGSAVVTPSSDIAVVLEQGLLYTAAAAMNGETIPTTDKEDCANTQGICPDGWHIPTKTEWDNLIGNNAYYVENLRGADLAKLNADGFNFIPYPYLSQGKAYLGKYLNMRTDSEYNIYASMLYFQSSTGHSATQNYAAMITNNNTKTSVNCPFSFLTNGCAVRCIKNK